MIKHLPRWLALATLTLLALVLAGCQNATGAAPSQPTAATVARNLFLNVDVVQGSKNVPADRAAAQSCVLSSRFPRNSQIVWRARVFDPKTGDVMDDKALSKVEIRLADGTNVAMHFAAHGGKGQPQEQYWTGSWMVPKDHATGSLNYTVVATAADGRTGEYQPFIVASALPAITDEVLPDAPAS